MCCDVAMPATLVHDEGVSPMDKSAWRAGFRSALPVIFWIAFSFYAAPKMSLYILAAWIVFGSFIIALSWWQGASAARDARQLKQAIAAPLGIDKTVAQSSRDFGDIAARKILELEEKVADLPKLRNVIDRQTRNNWIPFGREEKETLASQLALLPKLSIEIVHTGQQDCYELAIDLVESFREAGWRVLPLKREASPSAQATRSLVIAGKPGAPISGLLDAVFSVAWPCQGNPSPHYDGRTDITIMIGPRRMRDSEFL
jgi:hypothetical protein